MEDSNFKDSFAVFRTSQGAEVRANILRLTRHSAVFEVYSAVSVLQASEILSDLRIMCGDRTLYSGRALIRNLVSTGLVTVCEVSLDESWQDVDLSGAGKGDLGEQFRALFEEWQRLYRVHPEYKVVIADLRTFLTDLRLWLEQVELGVRSAPSGDRVDLERDIAERLSEVVVPPIQSLFERFESVAQTIEPELQPIHHIFGKRQVHSLLLCSPFVYRTFQKPLGYAGDYEMVNMMFRKPYEGSSLFAKMVNVYALRLPPILAHRNRITFLLDRLVEETLRTARQQRVTRVFSLGCGPAHEVQRFLARDDLPDNARFTLADFNDETLAHASGTLNELKRQFGRRTEIQLVKKSVQQLLKLADRTIQYAPEDQYDLLYCAGLFDYLSNRVCRKLMDVFYGMLAPGGLLVATNVDVHPSRAEMECFLEWHLIHRNTQQMTALTPGLADPSMVSLARDATGVNVFMSVRKPEP
jgi:extracellular factor (EF) 3-hydroxypalmitic acid methyl ester biosynthesis protein